MIPYPPIDDDILDDIRRRLAVDRRSLGALIPRLVARIDLEQREIARLLKVIDDIVTLGKDAA